jgi:hypothetical protein
MRTLFGIPVIVTGNIVPAGGPPVVSSVTLLEQSELMIADDGQTVFDASQEASLQMDSAPATPPTPLVSLWQQNLLGIKAERFIYWLMRRAAAVQEITGFPAGGTGLPFTAMLPPDARLSGAGPDVTRPGIMTTEQRQQHVQAEQERTQREAEEAEQRRREEREQHEQAERERHERARDRNRR